MLDGEETVEIACGELRWEGARQHAGRTGNRGNGLGRAQCRAVVAALSELLERFFRTNVIIGIVLKNCGSKTWK